MGMLVVVSVVVAFVFIVALWVHAVRAERSFGGHRWVVVVPLLILVGWLLELLIMH
ncbi:MAG TPA: hypothetical protein VL326_21205 [Kofleriaceae bacterium]|nr:hypothetical protein [Kofleriaceae bacterium]